jgi:hypothetical protein
MDVLSDQTVLLINTMTLAISARTVKLEPLTTHKLDNAKLTNRSSKIVDVIKNSAQSQIHVSNAQSVKQVITRITDVKQNKGLVINSIKSN